VILLTTVLARLLDAVLPVAVPLGLLALCLTPAAWLIGGALLTGLCMAGPSGGTRHYL
jgi:hypothetical protein